MSRLGLHAKKYKNIYMVCVLTWSLLGVKKSLATTPRSVSFRGLIEEFRRAFSPVSCEESPPGGETAQPRKFWLENQTVHVTLFGKLQRIWAVTLGDAFFLLFKADLDIYFEAVIQLPHQDFHLAGLCKI